MPQIPVVYCGFSETMVHYSAKSLADVRAYNESMVMYPKMQIQELVWIKDRKRLLRQLKCQKNFEGASDGMRTFLAHFHKDKWDLLSTAERMRHSYRNCLACVSKGPFRLKKYNQAHVALHTGNQRHEEQNATKVNLDVSRAWLEKTPHSNTKNIDQHKKEVVCSKRQQRAIVKAAQDEQMEAGKQRDLTAVFSTNLSLRRHDLQRRIQYGYYAQKKKTSHVGNLSSYSFDRRKAIAILLECAPDKNLGDRLRGRWSKLARDVNMTNTKGMSCNYFNGGQVMQEFARSKGFTFEKKSVKRVTWHKHKNGLAVYRSTSARELAKLRDQLIANGIIDIGLPICPIASNKIRINKQSGKVEEVESVIYGRLISLNKIRMDHLESMHQKGLLRRSPIDHMSRPQLMKSLGKHDSQGKYTDATPIEVLRQSLLNLETTRHIIIWQDHSDLAGNSHYVVKVWFAYDPAVFLTETEAGFKTQCIVERPYLHIIGQSKSTVKEQLAYVKDRVRELAEVSTAIQFEGREYQDIIRFNSGDLPARQYEAGQSIGGDYPCPCGVHIKSTYKPEHVLSVGPYMSIQERADVASISSYASTGIELEKMKQPEVETEAIARDLMKTWKESTATLKLRLKKELKGVKRLPALLTSGTSLSGMNCKQYEIMLCEPLHDFKNVIQLLLEELPYHVSSENLKSRISNFCESALGEKRQLRGCDARLHLINLVKLMEDVEFLLDEECSTISKLLRALTELQRLAYQLHDNRCARDILRAHLMAYRFACLMSTVFEEPQKKTRRRLFGTPFHSIVTHLPMALRLVSLRTIVAETAERGFHELRLMSAASAKQPDKLLLDIMVRHHFQQQLPHDKGSTAFESQQSVISAAAAQLQRQPRTILTQSFMSKYPKATTQLLRNISDFLVQGHGIWFSKSGGNLLFNDSGEYPPTQGNYQMSDFRKDCMATVSEKLDQSWCHCIKEWDELQLPCHLKQHLQPQAIDSGNLPSQQKFQVSDKGLDEEEQETDEGLESAGQPPFTDNTFPPWQYDSKTELKSDNSPSCSFVISIQKDKGLPADPPTSSVQREQKEEIECGLGITLSEHGSSKSACSSTSKDTGNEKDVYCTESSKKSSKGIYSKNELGLIKIWQENSLKEMVLKPFLKARRAAFNPGASKLAKELLINSRKEVVIKLRMLERKYRLQLEKLDREYYAKHKRLALVCLDKNLEKKMNLCIHFQKLA